LAIWATRLPETLPPERRRSVSLSALGEALLAVGRNRQTMGFGLAVTFLFGIMTGYVGSAEIIIDKVYDQADHFALFFGVVACLLGVGSLLSARLVMRLGLERLIRLGALYLLAAATFLALAALATDGEPPLWVFGLGAALILGGVALTVPNCNTAAMTPMGHVAGMAAAVLGTVSTAGGALLGSRIDSAFNGSIEPFAVGALLLVLTGCACIFVIAGRLQPIDPAEAARDAALSPSIADAVVPESL
jgi:DHA1 family bicyclomycin/chloramphenicol resistance-like MFS transporter